jgi:hypothetical protein
MQVLHNLGLYQPVYRASQFHFLVHKVHREVKLVDRAEQQLERCQPHLAKHFMFTSVDKPVGTVEELQVRGVDTAVAVLTFDQVETHLTIV